MIAFGLAASNDVVKLAGLDVGKVVIKCHATIDDDGSAFFELDALAKTIDHGAERAVIAGVAALGFGIAGAQALKIRRGQVVEIDRLIEIEQAALLFD